MADKVKPDKPEKETFWRLNNPIAFGVGISTVLIGAYLMLGLQTKCIANICETNFQRFFEAEPNEIGDTLAGLFAALAFVWIIVTVFLQSHELKEQRKEFREQRVATQDMARAMAAQAKIFEREQLERQEVHALRLAEELLKSLRYNLVNARLFWNFGPDNIGGATQFSIYPWGSGAAQKSSSDEEFICLFTRSFDTQLKTIKTTLSEKKPHSLPRRNALKKPIECLEQLFGTIPKLSIADRERFSRYELEGLYRQLLLYRDENIWSHELG